MKVEKRRGGWFAVPHNEPGKLLSGPWHTEEAAEFASEEKWHEAQLLEKAWRKSWGI